MLLIIILGLIAKLVLVSGDCDFGPLPLNDFNYTKFSDGQTWCFKYHPSDDFENNIDCLRATISLPEGNISYVTAETYDTSGQHPIIQHGNITNWNNNGCYDLNFPVELWKGRHYVVSIDYDRYYIFKICPSNSDKLYTYVGFRSCHPDEATKNDALKALKDNNIDVGQLVEWKADHCRQAESSTEGGSST